MDFPAITVLSVLTTWGGLELSESFEGKPVWEGVVHVFSLAGHPKAKAAYAWSAPIDGSKKHRYYAVLDIPPINSAQDAVKAAIVQEYRNEKNNF